MLQPRSTAARLCLNGVLLILAGYFCGAAIPHVPYPRITPVTAGVDRLSLTKSEVPS